MNHVHISFLFPLLWIFTALIVGPIWRMAAILLRQKPLGQALAFAMPGF